MPPDAVTTKSLESDPRHIVASVIDRVIGKTELLLYVSVMVVEQPLLS